MPGPDDYWSSGHDHYLDPETGILRNIPQLTTETQLQAFEETVFQAHFPEATAYAESCETYNLEHWKIIHGICFSDIYDWAGDIRAGVRINKGSTVFAYPENIESEADRIFNSLNRDLAAGTLTLEKCVEYYGELNVLHPFREGNGRTQRILFAAIFKRIGYRVDYRNMSVEKLIPALIAAYHGQYTLLENLFSGITESV